MRLLIVEDNRGLSEELARLLRRDAFAVDVIADAETVLHGVDTDLYDLMIIDLGLPGMGGLDLIARLRDQGCPAPILILTARDAVPSRVAGLDAGADDYVTKPFEIEELEARIRALLRRRASAPVKTMEFGPLVFDLTARQFALSGAPLALSPREHAVLETLMRRAGVTVSKEALIDSAYGFDGEVSPAAIEVVVHRLRRKLEGAAVAIATLRGFGYILRLQAP